MPRAEMCSDDKDGLSDEREMIGRWKQHYGEHLNGTESTGTQLPGNGRNDGMLDNINQPASTLREAKDVV